LILEEGEKDAKNTEVKDAERLSKPFKRNKRRKNTKTQKNIATVPVKELIRPKRLTLLQKVLF
jgi:hypothetical protein